MSYPRPPRLLIASLIALATLGASPAAPTTRPATRPTTQPTTQPATPPDRGPREALKRLAEGMRAGDMAAIHAILYADDPIEERMATAMATYAAALAGLQRAAEAAYGQEGARLFTGDAKPGEENGRIDAADVKVEGDDATVVFKQEAGVEPAEPVRLKRVEGRWRVPMSMFSKSAVASEIEQRLADLTAQGEVIQEVADDIAAGKYASADKAAESFRLKVYAINPHPTTQPATLPAATRPAAPPKAG